MSGFIVRFVQKVFDSIVEHRNRELRAEMEASPDYKRIQKNLERNAKAIEDWTKKHRAEDPEFAALEKDMRAILSPKEKPKGKG